MFSDRIIFPLQNAPSCVNRFAFASEINSLDNGNNTGVWVGVGVGDGVRLGVMVSVYVVAAVGEESVNAVFVAFGRIEEEHEVAITNKPR